MVSASAWIVPLDWLRVTQFWLTSALHEHASCVLQILERLDVGAVPGGLVQPEVGCAATGRSGEFNRRPQVNLELAGAFIPSALPPRPVIGCIPITTAITPMTDNDNPRKAALMWLSVLLFITYT